MGEHLCGLFPCRADIPITAPTFPSLKLVHVAREVDQKHVDPGEDLDWVAQELNDRPRND